jgi:uncharacterized protein YyaL (SSP411 family)
MSASSKPRNRLAREKSPYLLQHSENPVDWYPWGEEAFLKAGEEDKPIFLSIGYSTCHWCHVMAHESFEDDEVANLLNETFICIKVDREERPDIDLVYMPVCHAMTGKGGWPLTIIMTPERYPFFAASYIPKESRFGITGLVDLIPRVQDAWCSKRQEIEDSAGKLVIALQKPVEGVTHEEPGVNLLDQAYRELAGIYDPVHGGFGSALKFPASHNLLFLLRWWNRTGEVAALEMVEKTLRSMRRGGIFDQVGFGFHRYAVDREWTVPHFEKMLYDQAMLAMAYTETFQVTQDPFYQKVAEEIFAYVLRDLQDPDGGFYSAEDADSEGEEGKFYLWKKDELTDILDAEDSRIAISAFHVKNAGNFTEEVTGRITGKNILFLGRSVSETANRLGLSEDALLSRIEKIRTRLYLAREDRVRPSKDDKILTDWNGLMIAALAKAARVFRNNLYLKAAERAADFILIFQRNHNGRLLHRYRDGVAEISGHLDDYAFFIWGLLELYETGFDLSYLESALSLNNDMLEHFQDKSAGGFFFTPDDAETLIFRSKEVYDGAIPSGNSVSMLNMVRLARLTGESRLEEMGWDLAKAFNHQASSSPSAHTFLMCALDFAFGPVHEVLVAGELGSKDVILMLSTLQQAFLPGTVILFRSETVDEEKITAIAPFTKDMGMVEGVATAYVCEGQRCSLPTTDINEMMKQLKH